MLEEAHKMRYKSSRSRIETYESGSDEVLELWRLNSQSGKLEVLKIGKKYFESGFCEVFEVECLKKENWNQDDLILHKKLSKWDKEVLNVE